MNCKKCNTAIPDNTAFCPACGQKVEVEAPASESTLYVKPVRMPGERKVKSDASTLVPNSQTVTPIIPPVVQEPESVIVTPVEPIVQHDSTSESTHTAYFCQHCGSSIAPNAKFCSSCGRPLGASAAGYGEIAKNAAQDAGKKIADFSRNAGERASEFIGDVKKNGFTTRKQRIIGISGIVAVVLVVVILASLLFGGRSYKAAVEQFIDAQLEANGRMMVELIPEDLISYIMKEEGFTRRSELIQMLQNKYDDLHDTIEYRENSGWSYHFSYDIVSTTNADKGELKDIAAEYKDHDIKVSAAKTIEIECIVEWSKDEQETSQTSTMTLLLIKVGNSWYVDFLAMS